MNKDTSIIEVEGVLRLFPLNLKELDTLGIYKLVGGETLIINALHDYVPPISCACDNCDELAGYQAIVVKGETEYISYHCDEDIEKLIEMKVMEIPFEITN